MQQLPEIQIKNNRIIKENRRDHIKTADRKRAQLKAGQHGRV